MKVQAHRLLRREHCYKSPNGLNCRACTRLNSLEEHLVFEHFGQTDVHEHVDQIAACDKIKTALR